MSNHPGTLALAKPQLRELTGFVQYEKQKTALRAMGISFFTKPNGEPVVLWSALDSTNKDAKAPNQEPNFDALK